MVRSSAAAAFPAAVVTEAAIGVFTNYEGATLTADAPMGDTTLDLGSVSGLEVNNWLYGLGRTGPVLMRVTAVDAVNQRVTVTRAEDGTSDVDLTEGARVYAAVPAKALNQMKAEIIAIEQVLIGGSLLHGLTLEATEAGDIPLALVTHDEQSANPFQLISFKHEASGATTEVANLFYHAGAGVLDQQAGWSRSMAATVLVYQEAGKIIARTAGGRILGAGTVGVDDSTVILAGLNAVGPNGHIHLAEGTYDLDPQVDGQVATGAAGYAGWKVFHTVTTNLKVTGEPGTVLRVKAGSAVAAGKGLVAFLVNADGKDVAFEGLTWDGNRANVVSSYHALAFRYSCRTFRVTSNHVLRSQYSIWSDNKPGASLTNDIQEAHILNNRFELDGTSAMALHNTGYRGIVHGNQFTNVAIGVFLDSMSYASVMGNTFVNPSIAAVKAFDSVFDTDIAHNLIEGGAASAAAVAITLYDPLHAMAGGAKPNCDRNAVHGNIIRNVLTGIHLQGTGNSATLNQISGCTDDIIDDGVQSTTLKMAPAGVWEFVRGAVTTRSLTIENQGAGADPVFSSTSGSQNLTLQGGFHPAADIGFSLGQSIQRWASANVGPTGFRVYAATGDARTVAALDSTGLRLGEGGATAPDVRAFRGAPDRLDLESGDSFNLELGAIMIGGVPIFQSDLDLGVSLTPYDDSVIGAGTNIRRLTNVVANLHEVYGTLGATHPTSRLGSGFLAFGDGAAALGTFLFRQAAGILASSTDGAAIDGQFYARRFTVKNQGTGTDPFIIANSSGQNFGFNGGANPATDAGFALGSNVSRWAGLNSNGTGLRIWNAVGDANPAARLTNTGLELGAGGATAPSWQLSFSAADTALLGDGDSIAFGSVTGTKLGTSATQKLGFFGATPVVRPASIADPSGGAVIDAEARTAVIALITAFEQLGLITTV